MSLFPAKLSPKNMHTLPVTLTVSKIEAQMHRDNIGIFYRQVRRIAQSKLSHLAFCSLMNLGALAKSESCIQWQDRFENWRSSLADADFKALARELDGSAKNVLN